MAEEENNEEVQNPEDEMTPEEKAMMAALDGDDSAVAEMGGMVEVAPVELADVETVDEQPQQPRANEEDVNLGMILDIPVDINVELGRAQLSIRDILRLGSGSIIELDRLAGQPADIIVNGKRIGQGDVVVINENFGIRITKLVDPEMRLDSL